MERQAGHDYDVVVIGAGIGGLVCAARLARRGLRVAVFEKHRRPGGYCSIFRRFGFTFDVAVHMLGGCGPGGLLRNLLEEFEVADAIRFVQLEHFCRLIAPRHDIILPCDLYGYFAAFAEHFPAERAGLARLADLVAATWAEIALLMEAPPDRTLPIILKATNMARLMPLTFQQLLDSFLHTPQLKALLSLVCAYGGLPPERVSAMYMVSILGSYLAQGAYYPLGSSQALADVLVQAVRRAGGAVFLNRDVRRIRLEQGAVGGIELAGGALVTAARVVSNADATHTYAELIGREQLNQRLSRQLDRLEVSMSVFQVFLGVTGDIRLAGLGQHEVLYAPTYQLDEIYTSLARGEIGDLGFGICAPSLSDPGVARPDSHSVTLSVPVLGSMLIDWPAQKQPIADTLIAQLDRLFPGLGTQIVVREAATPLTCERFTRNRAGACYGWAQTPQQVGAQRLHAQTPIRGLFLTGHWTLPGGGVTAVASSGLKTADLVAQSLAVVAP